MKINRTVELSAIELMDYLKEALAYSCACNDGEPNLSGEEETKVLELYSVLKPLAEYVSGEREYKKQIMKIREEQRKGGS